MLNAHRSLHAVVVAVGRRQSVNKLSRITSRGEWRSCRTPLGGSATPLDASSLTPSPDQRTRYRPTLGEPFRSFCRRRRRRRRRPITTASLRKTEKRKISGLAPFVFFPALGNIMFSCNHQIRKFFQIFPNIILYYIKVNQLHFCNIQLFSRYKMMQCKINVLQMFPVVICEYMIDYRSLRQHVWFFSACLQLITN